MSKDGWGHPQRPWVRFWVFAGVWGAIFSLVLLNLIRFSLGSELESYIPLIPFITAYLLYMKPGGLSLPLPSPNQRRVGSILWIISVGLLVVHGLLVSGGRVEGRASALVLPVLSFITGLIGGVIFNLGLPAFRASLFPWLFLYLMVPIPEPAAHSLRVALQQGSAEMAYALFWVTGTPVLRDGLSFCLPGLTIQVAEECSGIHSSLVLLITSLIAGHLFLRKTRSQILLLLLVIPVSLTRNGFRVVTISLLTIHVDPGVIDGPLHHHGGPVFFVLSLGVLAAAVWGFRRYEMRRSV